ncbi:threonine synthase [Blochmannia endosymbiont of Polyrhachis (Hedomyrma) turneri]|uniref:threonine synthase n=1 Tax=Blochmannia endosymbiont of Polyrhachis (Hedomyrma) turneri TaxID=1505596 RepID=UPI00061A6739|nr:threonine synthase [Blochmannia endosymbiont of Polyrhachis (Hedomyrma) turneri]AKC59697.1 threonine synthase [Blochmannia endosymbiont of Polyrhachis (Hedomyrma) turneri]
MKFYNIKHPNDSLVDFSHAVIYGLGRDQGLFFPSYLPEFTNSEIDDLLNMDFITRSVEILSVYINNGILSKNQILNCVSSSFTFPVPVLWIDDNIAVLELFHGPTLAFKDFGARFMAQMLIEINKYVKLSYMTILTATSGDTGAAVAHAFHNVDNIQVVILYPENKISVLQEKLFSTLGGNIHTIAVNGDFDVCQLLVKQAFSDDLLNKKLFLNSANSMNICRLLAQVCYFFEAVAQLPPLLRNKIIISVPSGNFGNLTAGLLAKSLGLPIKRFIAATNINDTVPRFLSTGSWEPRATVPTLSNAMDVSVPSNWERIMLLFRNKNWNLSELSYGSVHDTIVCDTISGMFNDYSYLSEPHAAVSYYLLRNELKCGDYGLFLGTAHPAKFKDILDTILDKNIASVLLPDCLSSRIFSPSLSVRMPNNFELFREFMLDLKY